MRLLALVACALGASLSSLTFASDDCDRNSVMTKDIFQCANSLYENIDSKLNEQYSNMVARPSAYNRNLLLEGERAWIKYRDSRCEDIYESILPGEEAEIEKTACLISLTSSRLIELIYLETGANGDGFYNSLSSISRISSKNRDEILLYIEGIVSRPKETDYYKKNCELSRALYAEDEKLCLARMKFQSM